MKRIVLTSLFVLLSVTLLAIRLKPVEHKIGKLSVSIDPRTELLGVVQILNGYFPEGITTGTQYDKEARKSFAPYSSMKVVELTGKLMEEYGFAYHVPPGFMMHLSQPDILKRKIKYDDRIKSRAGGEKNLEEYRKAIRDFAKKTDFAQFWNSNKEFYDSLLLHFITSIGGFDLIKTLEEYYNESKNSYNIIICPLSGYSSYGGSILSKGGENIYSFSDAYFRNKSGLIGLFWHEFGHSFANVDADRFSYMSESLTKLFEPIAEEMEKQAYTSWSYIVDEHVVRAVGVRLTEKYFGEEMAKKEIERNKQRRFIYIEHVVEVLKEFERQRDEKGITFTDFYPELLKAFK